MSIDKRTLAGAVAIVGVIGLAAAAGATSSPPPRPFNTPGNVLIADQFNNRVIEIAPSGKIVWQYGVGPNDVSGTSPIAVNDALRVGGYTLISGTGAPAGSEPACPKGCADNRVFFVSPTGKIVWQYGQFGVTGSGPNQLNTPVQATWTATHTVLIADQANQRVIEVNWAKKILWQYGVNGVAGAGPNQLNSPNSVEVLDNGDLLIADEGNNRVIEVDRGKNIVATFTIGGTASAVAFASRLPNGDTLITDGGNNRIVEVDAHDKPVWVYFTNTQHGSNANPQPSRAVRLASGNTLISDQFNHRVIKVSPTKQIIDQWGFLNSPWFGLVSADQGLNAPYDAKQIGDNTGLTWFKGGLDRR